MLTLSPAAPVVNPSPAPSVPFLVREAWWAGFAAGRDGEPAAVPAGYPADLAGSFRDGHWSGRDSLDSAELAGAAEALALAGLAELLLEPADHTSADEQAWLGWTLGADGVDAGPAGGLTRAERDAFAAGHRAGDDHLWTVDPLWAAHLRDRAERAMADDAYLAAGAEF